MKVIHIGLGKTGTTSLQRDIFPHLERRVGLTYNPYSLWQSLRKDIGFHYPKAFRKNLHLEVNRYKELFVSLESLASTNPHLWEERADKNLEIFGKDSIIILSIKNPYDYIKSVYQQMLHQGTIIKPEDFFCTTEEYNKFRPLISDAKLELFDLEKLDYKFLIRLYRDRFSQVIVVTPKHLKTLLFLKNLFL